MALSMDRALGRWTKIESSREMRAQDPELSAGAVLGTHVFSGGNRAG